MTTWFNQSKIMASARPVSSPGTTQKAREPEAKRERTESIDLQTMRVVELDERAERITEREAELRLLEKELTERELAARRTTLNIIAIATICALILLALGLWVFA